MSTNVFDRLTEFLSELERKGINYNLSHNREEAIMVIAAAPGERWEIEFLEDGTIEVERFNSNGQICGEEALTELFSRYSETDGNDLEDTPQLAEISAFRE
jgi:hypothetical protein